LFRKEEFLSLGLELVFIPDSYQVDDPDEYIIFDDNLYFTQELLKEFIVRSQKQRKSTTCALKSGVTTLRTVIAAQEVKTSSSYIEYSLRYLPKEKFRGEYHPLVIDSDQVYTHIPMPGHICENQRYLIPMTERFIIQINHWVNLWAANVITLLAEGARLQKASKIKLAIFALKARSLDRWKILCQLNKIGRNCDIHPTAYIEGSTIGDDVTIGARVTIRESVIGSGAFIGNGVVIEESVIGEKSTILTGHILYSVLYPGTFTVAQMISASLIGKDTFIGSDVVLTDFRLDGKNVLVVKDGAKIDTGNKLIGCCLGHGVYLGAGSIVAPGRAIPGGMRIAPERERIVSSCNSDQNVPGFRLVKESVSKQ